MCNEGEKNEINGKRTASSSWNKNRRSVAGELNVKTEDISSLFRLILRILASAAKKEG
jgi:hypothetical protein